MRFHTLLCVLLPLLSVHGDSSCTLECRQEAPCFRGNANFSDHPTYQDGTPLPFQVPLQSNGMHCACPHGWTGVTCNRIFESCNGDHKCYNGGNCIPGLLDYYDNEQLFCDCSDALDENGNPYVGKFCEIQSKENCGTEEDDLFCVNGGECNPNYASGGSFCDCPSGFEGPHCEFEQGSMPQCTLDCQNQGECQFGLPPTTAEVHDLDGLYLTADGTAEDSMHCVCPPSFGGKFCDIEIEPCGSQECYHGGTCITRENTDGVVEYRCDCTTATYDGKSYAGRYCQFPSTVFCTEDQTENGKLFCVNGGTCRENAIEGCNCTSGYYGDSCEYMHRPQDFSPSASPENVSAGPVSPNDPVPAPTEAAGPPAPTAYLDTSAPVDALEHLDVCQLECLNDGICRKGVKDLGIITDIAQNVEELNQTSNADFEHCVCPSGFVGLRCEHKVEICPGGEHVCLHGSTCVANGNEQSCDCTTSTFTLAGSSCEHKSFVSCNQDELGTAQPRSFCVNGGICKTLVSETEAHPGCECPDQHWEGPHCELHKATVESTVDTETAAKVSDPSPDATSSPSELNNGVSMGVLVVGILALVASLVVMVHTHVRNKKERRRMEQERKLTLALATHRELEVNKGVQNFAVGEPEVYLGPPRDEDGHELHQIEIL